MERLPVLPLGQLVVYPHVVLPLALTDPKAVQLIDEVIQGEKRLLLGEYGLKVKNEAALGLAADLS